MYLDDYFVLRKGNCEYVVERVTDNEFYIVIICQGIIIGYQTGVSERNVEDLLAFY